MPPLGFVSTISAGERPQSYVLDRAATGTDITSTTTTIAMDLWTMNRS